MTRKLYYEDCHLAAFSAVVTGCEKSEKGFAVTLDATAFYPEGGGQACDLGTLGSACVLDVQERGEEVIHLCDTPLEPRSRVEGIIDYQRRFHLMQQHTGEHIVSGIIHRRYGYHNVGFHMGANFIEIDFDGVIPAEDLAEIEREANEALWKNLPVKCWYPGEEELPHVFYRTKKALPWPVRIVQVPGYDSCACCGVHVAHTGEVGLVKLFSVVGLRGGSRIEMACGAKALELLNRVYEQNKQVSQTFSAKIFETGWAAKRMNEALATEKFRLTGLQRRLFTITADSYVNHGAVLHFEEGLEPTAVRELADAISHRCGGRAAVFSGSDETGYSYCLAAREGDLRPFGKELNAALNGRGGGKPNFLQGSVKATRCEIEKFFEN
jgi:alanyl-tRNA synthetase